METGNQNKTQAETFKSADPKVTLTVLNCLDLAERFRVQFNEMRMTAYGAISVLLSMPDVLDSDLCNFLECARNYVGDDLLPLAEEILATKPVQDEAESTEKSHRGKNLELILDDCISIAARLKGTDASAANGDTVAESRRLCDNVGRELDGLRGNAIEMMRTLKQMHEVSLLLDDDLIHHVDDAIDYLSANLDSTNEGMVVTGILARRETKQRAVTQIRVHTSIDKLPKELRDSLTRMVTDYEWPDDFAGDKIGTPRYIDLVEYCRQKGYEVKKSVIGRFGLRVRKQQLAEVAVG